MKIPATPMTQPQAVRRAVAALFDLLCIVVVYRMFGGALPETAPAAIGRAAPLLLLWAALDAAATARLGSSPGRALMGIRISGAEDRPLSWPRALLRSVALPLLLLLLLRAGFTFFIGAVALVLTARRVRAGLAPWWDDVAGARVSYGEFSATRGALAVMAFFVGLAVVVLAG